MARSPRLGKSPVEFGDDVYSAEQVEEILKNIVLVPAVDQKTFVRELNRVARWARELDAEIHPPSTRERKWARAATAVGRVAKLFSAENELCLEEAARDLARRDDPPPGCERSMIPTTRPGGEPTDPMPYWEVEDQLRQLRKLLPWLHRCCEHAARMAEEEKALTGGNRSSPAFDSAIDGFSRLFCRSSAIPARAYSNSVTGPAGNLVDFLQACLKPLEWRGSRYTILDGVNEFKRRRPDLFAKD